MDKRGFSCIALDNPKSDVNVGSALRAAGVYGVDLIVASGTRYKHSATDTRNQHKHTPFIRNKNVFDALPLDCVPVAVDLVESAISLPEYKHPERAFYIFGAEDATLGKRVIDKCRDVIYVPTDGCMNLAATVNVILYDRLMKQLTTL